MFAHRPRFCRLGWFSSIFLRTYVVGVCGSDRSEGIMYYLRKGSRCAFTCNRWWYRRGLISCAAGVCAAGAPVCVRLSGHTARLARPAPPRRLIGPSITAAARARALHPAALRGADPAPARVPLSTLGAGRRVVFPSPPAAGSTDALMPRRAQQRSRRIFKTDT